MLTGNGKEFTGRLFYRDKQASSQHEFDQLCAALSIEHRLTRPRAAKTLNKPCSTIACFTTNTCPRPPLAEKTPWTL
jgi:hypothetical protein